MERRKLQNREAQRRYRENIKRKLKMAERQLESKGDSGLMQRKFDTGYGSEADRLCDVQDGLGTLDSTSPILDFDWTALDTSCLIQDGLGILSPPESTSPKTPIAKFGVHSTGINQNHSPTLPTSGSTLMHVAAHKGYDTIVRILSESGVDIAAKDDTGQTPLHLAAARGHTRTIVALLEAGAEVDARNDQGKTPLFVAVSNGADTVVRLLLQRGADPNVRVLGAGSGIDLSMVEDAVLENFSVGD